MPKAKNILVTGAAAGFGALIARTLIERGHTVFATLRDPSGRNAAAADALREHARGKTGKLHVLELDVLDEASAEAAVGKALETAGRLDAVVNNAGIGPGLGTYAEALGLDQFRRAFDVNVLGIHRLTRAALPAFRAAERGLFVNVSSIMGRVVLPYSALYTATKFAVEGLTESYRYELSPLGIDVVLIEPGGFPTGFFGNAEPPSDPERLKGYGALASTPETLYAGFRQAILEAENRPDPQAVADAVAGVVDTPAGKRPARVVVDPLMGGAAPEAVNKAAQEAQTGLFKVMGQERLLEVAVRD